MKTALELATGVACGIAYIHRKEVLHLDIKLVRDPC
jgi:serine/threonine protein kinase